MRKIERIPELTAKIEELWNMFPDLRFWQLVSLIAEDEIFKDLRDPFYLEDDKWLEAVERVIKKYT